MNKILQELRPYWRFKDFLVVMDGKIIKGICIIIPKELQKQALEQLHRNHIGLKKQDYRHVNIFTR